MRWHRNGAGFTRSEGDLDLSCGVVDLQEAAVFSHFDGDLNLSCGVADLQVAAVVEVLVVELKHVLVIRPDQLSFQQRPGRRCYRT